MLGFVTGAVDQLVVRLVEVGEQTAITAPDTGLAIAIHQELGISRRDGFVDFVKMQEGQSFPGNLAKRMGVFNQAVQDTGPALGSLIREDRAAVVAGGQRLPKDFAFFQLEGNRNSPQERMLDGRDRLGGVGFWFAETQQERVLAVSHDWHDADRFYDIRRYIDLRILVF